MTDVDALPLDDAEVDDTGDVEARGVINPPTVDGLPTGYTYGITRYADVILREAFPDAWKAIVKTLASFTISLTELQTGGGGRTLHVERFDNGLKAYGWAKKNIALGKTIDGEQVYVVRGHEIDMFTLGPDSTYPGVAVEMEWNNKDPFFDRDLINFQALHREGVLAAGVIVTRGPHLQALLADAVFEVRNGAITTKYGSSSTHWHKLVPRVTLGGGGECPLLLIGIEPQRIDDLATMEAVAKPVRAARLMVQNQKYKAASMTRADALAMLRKEREQAMRAIPPIKRMSRTRKAPPPPTR